jgi:hypothetical protein
MGSSAGAFLLLKVYYLFATVRGKEIMRAFQIKMVSGLGRIAALILRAIRVA